MTRRMKLTLFAFSTMVCALAVANPDGFFGELVVWALALILIALVLTAVCRLLVWGIEVVTRP